jgi:hypothetical protein
MSEIEIEYDAKMYHVLCAKLWKVLPTQQTDKTVADLIVDEITRLRKLVAELEEVLATASEFRVGKIYGDVVSVRRWGSGWIILKGRFDVGTWSAPTLSWVGNEPTYYPTAQAALTVARGLVDKGVEG